MLLRTRILAVVGTATVLLAGCGGTSGGPPASPVARANCAQKSVKIAIPVTPPNVVHIPPYVAWELGYFKDENLDVSFEGFVGGVGALRSAAGLSVNLAGTSTEPLINAIAQGGPVRAVYTYAPNVDVSFVVGPNVKQPSDLKGKKIGIQEPGGFADFMSRIALKKAGIDPKDVTFVQTKPDLRVQAMITGQVDTGVLHIDQTLTAQKRAPGLRVLYDMWDILSGYQYSVYAAGTSEIQSDPATVECMVRALVRADRAMYDPAKRDQMIDIAVKYTKEDKDVVTQTFDTLVKAKAWPKNEGFPSGNIQGVIDSLKQSGQLNKDLSQDQVVDMTFINRVLLQLGRVDFPY